MNCPDCESDNCFAIDSRIRRDGIRRRRYKCLDCGYRYTTVEIYAGDHDKLTEAFQREKTVRKVAEKIAALTELLK
jgi:transcriptional regulator NrdR family protein